jgi:hypothetical protein
MRGFHWGEEGSHPRRLRMSKNLAEGILTAAVLLSFTLGMKEASSVERTSGAVIVTM